MATRSRNFAQIDVFSSVPYYGNPVAVVLEADGLTDQQMQQLASWTNLSETTFLLPPTNSNADYRLRIFTPGGELPFAGHPTLGSAHAWLEQGGSPKTEGFLVQECGAGLVTLKQANQGQAGSKLSFMAPKTIRSGGLDTSLLGEIVLALGISNSDILDHQWVDNGPGWAAVLLKDADQVLRLKPKFQDDSELMFGVVGAYPAGSEKAFELRAFAPKIGVFEDPVTGSLNASVAQWLFRSGLASGSYLAGQGKCLGRNGEILLSQDSSGEVWVGGSTVTCIHGVIQL
jgi:PhzF family phenazine biosynthesis protein